MNHAYHFYGDPVPLVRNHVLVVFECGGLLFAWFPDGERIFVVHGNITPEQLATTWGPHGAGHGPATILHADALAVSIGWKYFDMWEWENESFNRNRWVELRDRGGLVHTSLLEYSPLVPPPLP